MKDKFLGLFTLFFDGIGIIVGSLMLSIAYPFELSFSTLGGLFAATYFFLIAGWSMVYLTRPTLHSMRVGYDKYLEEYYTSHDNEPRPFWQKQFWETGGHQAK